MGEYVKRFVVFLSLVFCSVAYADTETINWYMDDNVYATTTCESGGDITLPTTPTKYGYTFQGWSTYTPIEYLETNNGSFINTNFIPLYTANLYIKISFEFSSIIDSAINGVFGYMDTSMNPRFGLYYDANSNANTFGSGVNSTVYWNTLRASIGVKYTAELNDGIFVLAYDNNSKQIQIGTGNTQQTSYPIYVGSRCDQKAYPRWPSNIRIYKFELIQGETHIDLIPVLDVNRVPCMYDRVENKFYYNAGMGDFIAGPVIGE